MTEFTPEYIAECRKAKGGVWMFPEAKTALDEIERSHDMIDRLIKAGAVLRDERYSNLHEAFGRGWDALVTEWWSR